MSKESKVLIGILVLVVAGLVGLFVFANSGGSSSDNTAAKGTLVRPNSHKLGTGSVQVVEFGDFQCPACGRAQAAVKQVESEFNGKMTLYFRNFPLAQHANALVAANAAEEASAEGKFWEMHDQLYATQADWSTLSNADAVTKFAGYATSLGLDGAKVKAAASNQTYKSIIDQDTKDGTDLGIEGTPTFFVNGTKVNGIDYPSLRDAINAALKP
jgi:protein-disulfide isomerase